MLTVEGIVERRSLTTGEPQAKPESSIRYVRPMSASVPSRGIHCGAVFFLKYKIKRADPIRICSINTWHVIKLLPYISAKPHHYRRHFRSGSIALRVQLLLIIAP